MVSLKPTRFFFAESVLFLSFCFPFFCPFPFVSFFSFSLSLSFLFSFLFRFFLFPLPFSLLFLSFLFPLPFPFLFLFLFLPFSFSFSFLFLSLSFLSTLSPSISPMRALDEINTHEVQHGVSLFGKVPSLSSVFLHFMKTNVQRIHILVFGSFDDCSYTYSPSFVEIKSLCYLPSDTQSPGEFPFRHLLWFFFGRREPLELIWESRMVTDM